MATAVERIRERARKNGIELSSEEPEKEQRTVSAAERIRERAEKNGIRISVDEDTVSARRLVIPSSRYQRSVNELGAHGGAAEIPEEASLKGETRRSGTKGEDGTVLPGARWESRNRQVNATVRSADEIRKDLAAVDEEIKAAKIWQGNGLVGGSNPSGGSAEERAQKLSVLETTRERLRQELAENRNALKNNADYAEKNQADAGFASMTDDAMYRLVNYPDQPDVNPENTAKEKLTLQAERQFINSPTQQESKASETLKNLVEPIYTAIFNDSQYIKSMTDEERQTYNYIYKTEGRESADEYLDLIKEGLTKRSTEETGTEMEQFAEEHPVLSSAYTVATLPAKGASALGGSLGTYLSGQELDRNASYNALANASADIRGTVSKQIEEKWGKVGSFAYDVGMSMADFLAMGVIGKGTQIPLMILGSNAAADMTISALDRGLSDGKAMALGLVAGIAEAAAEKVGIDKLFKNPNWNKNSLLYILQNVFSEVLEEGGTSIVNSLADILVSRDQSEWQQSINAYREQGFSDKDAFWNAFKDTAIMIGLDALGGAISGGLMGAGGVAVGKIGQGAVNRENVRQGQETIRAAVKEQRQSVRDSVDNPDTFVPGVQSEAEPISSRVYATAEGEELEIGREVRRDQLMTLEQQERADAIDAADDLDATAMKYEATPRQRNEARELQDLTGRGIEFFRQKSPQGSVKHGLYDPTGGKIYLNVNSSRTVPVTVGHEVTHTLEGTAAYDAIHDYVIGAMQSEGKNVEAEREKVRRIYENAGKPLDSVKEIDADMVAEYVGTKLLDDVRAIREVYRENPSVGRKIASAIDKMLIKTTGMEDMTVRSYLERASAVHQRVEEIVEKSEAEINRRLDEEEAAQATGGTTSAQGAQGVRETSPAAQRAVPETSGVRNLSETVGERRTAPQTGGRTSGSTNTSPAGMTEQGGRNSAPARNPAAEQLRDEAWERFDAGEITEDERDEMLQLADEMEFTGSDLSRSATTVDTAEGKISGWFRNRTGGKKKDTQFSISEEEVEERVRSGRPVEAADEVRWSISMDKDYMDAADRANEQKKFVPYNVLADARDARERIREIFTDPSLTDSLNLPPENIGNTYIPNGSYDGTEENTTVCIRSMAADALMDAVAEYLGRPLTVEDTITVSQEYWQYTDQPECLYCYVAMDRKAYREFLGSYLEQRNNALADLRSGMSKEEAYRRFLDGRVTSKNPNGTKPMRDRFDSWVRYMENGTEMITEADLASEKSMQDAAARSPELAAQINDARKYAQGASWAKKRIGYTAYNNHILKWTDDRIRKLNSQFGLRLYSFSDFSPAFILENMQMITDASVRGLKMLAYTKDINFAKIFAPSGININISTFAYEGADGTMVQDGMQGADWAEAQAMRDQFENVGITFVAVNDAQVDWAISQDWIDVVIPFHLVRTGAKVAESFGWKNYTQMFGEVKSADWSKGDKKNIFPAEHQNDRERYFEALRKNHLEPRFRDWADNPNYMKLVNETRRSAGETSAVQPVFDVDAAKAAIEEMRKRGGYYRPIGNTDENMREIAGEIADKIRYSVTEEDQTKTKWFKRWFGDWENDPANASKIVNADGTPKVMYHGSKNNFYEFSNDVAGGLFHFAPDESASGSYAVSAGGARGQLKNSDIRVVDADGNVYEYDGAESWGYIGRLRNDEKFWDVSDTNIEDADPLYDAPDVFGEREVERLVDTGEMTAIPKQTYVNAFYLKARNPLHMDNSAIPVLREIYNALEADGRHSNELSRTLYYLRNDMNMWPATKNEASNREWQNMIVPELKKRGYDSISFRDKGHDTVAVFDPAQIKSATGNIGTFNSNDPDVRFSISEEEPTDAYSALPTKAQTRVRDLERNFGVALDKMFGLGMTYKSEEFGQYVRGVVRPLTEAYLQNGEIPQEETDAVFAEHYNPLSGTDETLQRDEFYRAVEQLEAGLNTVRRFAEGNRTSADTTVPENPMPTAEEAEELFRVQRDARREMDKVMRKVLLTPEDEVTVGELLRGTKSEDQITENRQDILAAYHAQKAFRDADAAVGVYRKRLKAELYKYADSYLGNIGNWKDKNTPFLYHRESPERNIRDIIPDKAEAEAFIEAFITPVHHAEAERKRFIQAYQDRITKLNISGKQPSKKDYAAGKRSEAYAVQFIGEAEENIRILSMSGKIVQKRDNHTLEEWKHGVEAFWAANPEMDRAKIENAVKEFRQIYNELLPKINEMRIRNGYAPVPERQGYFPHFFDASEDTLIARILRPFGIQFGQDVLPTAINGRTADFRPGISYFQFGNQRLGFNTTYDALQGFSMYLDAASNVIYHTDNIQKLRALANRIRYLTGDEGIREQLDKIENDDSIDEAEKQERRESVTKDGRYLMSNLVVWMDEYTNILANKKSRFDRSVEELAGRNIYNRMKAIENRVAGNMIAGNLGSALTNIIPLNQAAAMLTKGSLKKVFLGGEIKLAQAMWLTLRERGEGFASTSDFLTNRRGTTSLVRTNSQKFSDIVSKPMEIIDNFVSETIVRAFYREYLADGMGEELALRHADAMAASIMGDRSKGALPTLFHARNPLMKLFTQFQVEINNEYSVIFKDIPELAKANAETKAGVVSRIAVLMLKYFIGAKIFNDLFEKLFGRRPALDPAELINDAVGGLIGYQMPNTVDLIGEVLSGDLGAEDFATERKGAGQVLTDLRTGAIENLPFIGSLAGGGRLPIQSAFPDAEALESVFDGDQTLARRGMTLYEELSKPAAYLLPPAFGGQLRNILNGIIADIRGGVYDVKGGEDGGEYMKYPVYDDPWNRISSAVFGPIHTEGGVEWIDSGYKNLSVTQTAAYEMMKQSGVDDRAAYDLIQEYKAVPDGEGKTTAQREVIRSAEISGEGKFAAYFTLGSSEEQQKLMDEIFENEASYNLGEAANVLMDIADIKADKQGAQTSRICDVLAQSALSERSKKLIFAAKISDQKDDDISTAELAGITFDEYLDAHSVSSALRSDSGLSNAERALEFTRYVDKMNLTDSQKQTMQDIFKFYSQIPVTAKKYNELRDAGISDDYAVKLIQAMDALEPLPGEKSVSAIQKARTVLDTISDPDERLATLGTVLSESQYKKVSIAAESGLEPELWVDFREILPEFDADGNGSYTQSEVEDAIRALSDGTNYGTLLGKIPRNLSKEEMAILWQMSGNWNADNNPFSRTTGRNYKKLLEE